MYPVERVFLAEIRGKDDQLYAREPTRQVVKVASYQNSSFSANWICREVVEVAVMTPPEGL